MNFKHSFSFHTEYDIKFKYEKLLLLTDNLIT